MDLSILNKHVFDLTNQEREKRHSPTLAQNSILEKASKLHSENMVKHNFYSHTDWNNSTFFSPQKRIIYYGGNFQTLGENIYKYHPFQFEKELLLPPFGMSFSFGKPTQVLSEFDLATALVRGWMNSWGHRRNILYKGYKYLGVGSKLAIHSENSKCFIYCTQNFGG